MSRSRVTREVRSRYRNHVRACRLRAEVAKQETLARCTGIPRTTVSALECNKLFLSAPYALLIRDALGCSMDDLYERVECDSEDDTKAPGRRE
jgi:DNA-binding XRE family transcriptional regulator